MNNVEKYELLNAVNEFKDEKTKDGKNRILEDNRDNEVFKSYIKAILDPLIVYGIQKKKLSKFINKTDGDTKFKSIFEVFDYLLINNTGKDADAMLVAQFIDSEEAQDLKQFYTDSICKQMKIGATASTINKVWGEQYISQFDVMLAEKYIETKKVKGVAKVYEHWRRYLGKRVIATKKLDGNRVAVFVRDDGVELFSREGHKLEGFIEIEEAFSFLPKGQVYDGEVLATNEEGLNSQDLFKKTSKIVKKKGIKAGLEFHAFDLLPIANFESGVFDTPCETRKKSLELVVSIYKNSLIKYVEPLYIGEFDFDLMDKFAEEAKSREEEGIMVQLAEAPYSCKRTFDILKVKSFESADIRCLDVYEGKTGKNIGRLGGLVLDYKGHKINIGGGFSDELRIKIWADPTIAIGKIVEITYFEEFQDENGDLDLRFGIFKDIRTDKTEPSYY